MISYIRVLYQSTIDNSKQVGILRPESPLKVREPMKKITSYDKTPEMGELVEGRFKTAPNANTIDFEGPVTQVFENGNFMVRDTSGISIIVQRLKLFGKPALCRE